MGERGLVEVVAHLNDTVGCKCQIWTGLKHCTCEPDDEPEPKPQPSEKQEKARREKATERQARYAADRTARVERLAQVLYVRPKTSDMYLLDRVPITPWEEAGEQTQAHWRHEATLMLMRNGVL